MSIQGKFFVFLSSLNPFSKGNLTFGFSRILTQTLTHTGIRVHGTSGTNRASERGFPSPQGRKSARMSPHRIQTAAHNPKVVGSSPASATTKKPMKPWFHRFFSFCPESLLTHTLTQTRKGPERFRKRPRGHSPSHQLPAAGLRWSHGRRYPE